MFGRRGEGTEERAQATNWGIWPGDSAGPTWAGVDVSSQNAMQLVTVYGCVRLISDALSSLPLDVYRERPDGTREELTTPTWLNEPVVGLHRSAWLSQIVTSVLLEGNAYFAVLGTNRIEELPVLDPSVVKVKREGGRRVFYVNGQVYPGLIVHIPGLMMPGAEVGVSPVEMARQSIGGGMAAQEYSARFFGQGATMSGVIEVPNKLPAGGPEVSGSAAALAKMWSKLHSGRNKAHLPGVLEGGATWKPTGVTPEQAQFLQTRGFTAAEIAGQMFLLDPSDLGIPMPAGSSITYANLEQRNQRRVQVVYLPLINRIEAALSALLASPRYVKFNVDAQLRGDTKTRFEAYQIAATVGFLTVNEIRELEDLPPLPGGAEPTPVPAQDGTNA